MRPSPLQAAITSPLLHLPIENGKSLLDVWREEAAGVALAAGVDRLAVRVLLDREYGDTSVSDSLSVQILKDPSELRGTGGLLRDVSAGCDGDEYLLVANLAQLPLQPLPDVVARLADSGGDVVIGSHADGTPSGLMLVKAECLRLVPDVGFVDFKEQALPVIARRYHVNVLTWKGRIASPLRTLADYVAALRLRHGPARAAGENSPFAESWAPVFSVVEPGAAVDGSAQVLDSVVMNGGTVERGAVIVRSLVCDGGVVGRNQTVVDSVVTADGRRTALPN